MNQLTKEKAKKIYEENLNKIEIKELRDFLLVHSKKVKEIAVLLGNRKNLDVETLEIAGWIHDIGYIIDEKEHAKNSFEILEKEGYEISETLKDCILNHGHTKKPLTPEGEIFQMADYISMIYKDILNTFLQHNKSKIGEVNISFLEMMISQAISFIKRID